MRIGIIGAGKMAEALGTHWLRAGHQVMVSGRDKDKTAKRAQEMDALAGTPAEAAALGEVVLLAVPGEAVAEALPNPGLAGKVLIDCTNAMDMGRLTRQNVAREVARISGARVVKAFSMCAAEVYAMTPPAFDGVPLTVPVCGDDPDALATVRQLVRDAGCEPADGGGLDRAALAEATTAFIVPFWFAGVDAQRMLPPLTHVLGEPEGLG